MTLRLSYDSSGTETIEMNGLDSPEEKMARIAIGHDDDSGAVYSAVVALCRIPWMPAGNMELQFDIVECVDGIENWHNDGLHTKRFLSGKNREYAFGLLCLATDSLVRRVLPDAITMVTVTTRLPQKALGKYEKLCDVVRAIGYEGGQADQYAGSRIWMLKKKVASFEKLAR